MKFQKAFPLIIHLSERLATILLCFFLVTAFLPTGSSITAGYRDRATLLQDFFNLMSQYPTLMTYESIGKSYQGRDIPMFMIGNPNGGKVLFTVATHGDEIQGGEVAFYMAEWILERREPEIADRILRNNLILIVIGNIDSYGITRKNMDLYGYIQGANPNSYGVDLNRNMPVGWGGKDSSNNETDMHYQGPSPGSEPESQALVHVFQTCNPKFHLNYHYGGGIVFGKPSGYAGMSASMSQYHDVIANKTRILAASRGVRVFGYGQLGISGCVTDQAYASGNSTSYLLEAGNWPAPLYAQIESVLLPQLLPFLIVFAQESEVVGKRLADLDYNIVKAPSNQVFFIQTRNSYDVQGIGYFYTTCNNSQNTRAMDDSLTVTQQGPNQGEPLFNNKAIVLFGGPLAHLCTRYYENTMQTPLLFANSSYGTGVWGFVKKDGEKMPNAAINFTALDEHRDLFTVETFIDSDNNFVVVAYGLTQFGTLAAGPYFRDNIVPNIGNFSSAWYIFGWQDGSNGNPLDGFPQSGEVAMITFGN